MIDDPDFFSPRESPALNGTLEDVHAKETTPAVTTDNLPVDVLGFISRTYPLNVDDVALSIANMANMFPGVGKTGIVM